MVPPTRPAPTGVTYCRPDLRPTWRTCAAIMACRRPASLIMTGLRTLVIGPITTRTNRDGRTTAGVLRPGTAAGMFDAFIIAFPSLPVPPVDGTGKDGLASGKVTRLSRA